MKIKLTSFLAICVLSLTASIARAHDDDKKVAGPNGGRILTTIEPRAEFFVTPDRKVQITFLGADGQAIAPADQSVTVTAGNRTAPTTLQFAKSGDRLLSDGALPAGNRMPAVVQIKASPEAKVVIERFTVNLATCPECKYAEYACICDH